MSENPYNAPQDDQQEPSHQRTNLYQELKWLFLLSPIVVLIGYMASWTAAVFLFVCVIGGLAFSFARDSINDRFRN